LPPLKQLPTHVNSKLEKVESLLEVAGNAGQKKMFESGLKRLQRFSDWCFDSPETKGGDVTVVVSGHSLFFRTFFQAYLSRTSDHEAKKKKIINGGAVAVTLERGVVDGSTVFRIDPASIEVIYGGFGK